MKKFVYQVGGYEFVGFEAFGDAWKQAKAKAAELHAGVYRLVIKGEIIKQEVYINGGVFLSVDRVQPEQVLIF